MKEKIKEKLINVWDEIEYRLRLMCGRPSPMKRFIIVLIISGALCVAFIYTLVSSIYKIGKRDAEKELIDIKHIEAFELQKPNDSIQTFKNKEYEQE